MTLLKPYREWLHVLAKLLSPPLAGGCMPLLIRWLHGAAEISPQVAA
jgi:hypothetical protein